MEDSPNDIDSSEGNSQDQYEDSCRNTAKAIEENLPPVGEHASANQCLSSPRSADAHPSQELQSHTNCSSNGDALVSPRHLADNCISIIGNPNNSKAKASQKDLPPVAAGRNMDFASPPERGTFSMIRSFSSNLKDTNTPSPEKRSVETDVELTPIKRLRKTSGIESSKPGPSKSDNPTISVLPSLSQEMLARITSNTATGSPRESSNSDHYKLAQSLPSDEKSMSSKNSEQQMQQNRNAPLLQRSRHAIFLSDKTSTSRYQSEGVRDMNPPHIDVVEGQATSSSYQPIVTVGSSFVEASRTRNEREVSSDINVTDVNVCKGHTSTSRYEPISTGNFFYDQSFFPTSRKERAMGELSTVKHPPSPVDSSSSTNLSDIQPERHPEYVVQARLLLLSVLKEIMLHDEEDYLWSLFEESFRAISEPYSQLDSLKLIADLARYSTKKVYDGCDRSLLPCELIEKQTQSIYGKLTVMVIKALICALSVRSSRDYLELVVNHVFFRCEFASFSHIWNFSNIEHIQDEASRNRVTTLKEMIQRLLLVVQMVFQLLLMYVGENISETVMTEYEDMLSDADKVYLRRNPMHRP